MCHAVVSRGFQPLETKVRKEPSIKDSSKRKNKRKISNLEAFACMLIYFLTSLLTHVQIDIEDLKRIACVLFSMLCREEIILDILLNHTTWAGNHFYSLCSRYQGLVLCHIDFYSGKG